MGGVTIDRYGVRDETVALSLVGAPNDAGSEEEWGLEEAGRLNDDGGSKRSLNGLGREEGGVIADSRVGCGSTLAVTEGLVLGGGISSFEVWSAPTADRVFSPLAFLLSSSLLSAFSFALARVTSTAGVRVLPLLDAFELPVS